MLLMLSWVDILADGKSSSPQYTCQGGIIKDCTG